MTAHTHRPRTVATRCGYALCLLALAAATLCCSGCHRCTARDDAPSGGTASTVTAPEAALGAPRTAPSLSLLDRLDQCDVSHRGILIDLGTQAADVRRGFSVGPFTDVVASKRGNKTIAQAMGRDLSYGFWLQRASPPLSVALRVRGGTAERVGVYLDDERLGTLRLPLESAGQVQLPAGHKKLEAGRHTVTLRFIARRRSEGDPPYAEIDWIWVGDEDDLGERYAPPTLDDIVSDVVLGGQPLRSLVLPAPATVRCVVQAGSGEQLELGLGYWGNGEGTAQVRALVEGEPPVVLAEHALSGGDDSHWTAVSADLHRFEGKLVALEFSVLSASGSGRVAFGEPHIESPAPVAVESGQAQNVVLVVMSGLSRDALPPWGSAQGLRAMTDLVRQGVTFNGYRTRSTASSAVVASLLTGLPPLLHTVLDTTQRLPSTVFTLAELLKQAGGKSAMFTGVPTSFAAFGLDRGWDHFEAISPVEDLPANQPITLATDWLQGELTKAPMRKHLLVIHARGGHPPWDLSREDAANLPPEEYSGVLEPRRGGIILQQLREQAPRSHHRLRGEDWTRLRAMQAATLRKQDQALARLIDLLREREQWDNTLFVFAADVPMGDPPAVPFGIAPLSEDRLLTPLLVKFPSQLGAGSQVGNACTSEDIARTISDALQLPEGGQIQGESLLSTMAGWQPPGGRPLVALMGSQFSTRWGPWLLLGEFGSTPRLCQLEVDPSCVSDLFADHPIAVTALWRSTYLQALQRPTVAPEQVKLDEATKSALIVWGE